jgi:hypothetical protein
MRYLKVFGNVFIFECLLWIIWLISHYANVRLFINSVFLVIYYLDILKFSLISLTSKDYIVYGSNEKIYNCIKCLLYYGTINKKKKKVGIVK